MRLLNATGHRLQHYSGQVFDLTTSGDHVVTVTAK